MVSAADRRIKKDGVERIMPGLRPRRRSIRPSSEPIFTSPTGMDFEKRRLIVPPSFIDLAVLQGGDEYVKASDLATIVNAFIKKMEELRIELAQVKWHLASLSDENIEDKDAQ